MSPSAVKLKPFWQHPSSLPPARIRPLLFPFCLSRAFPCSLRSYTSQKAIPIKHRMRNDYSMSHLFYSSSHPISFLTFSKINRAKMHFPSALYASSLPSSYAFFSWFCFSLLQSKSTFYFLSFYFSLTSFPRFL